MIGCRRAFGDREAAIASSHLYAVIGDAKTDSEAKSFCQPVGSNAGIWIDEHRNHGARRHGPVESHVETLSLKEGQQMLRELPLQPWASRRREDLLRLLEMFHQQIAPLDAAVKAEAERDPQARLLMTQPGVGPITSLAYVLTMGDVSRFARGKQVASYLGLIPREHSSGGRQKLGAITKQGNRMLRMLLVEAATIAVRYDPEFRKEYQHRCHAKPKAVAKVAAARKLAIRLYWMLRTHKPYPEVVRIESSPRVALVGES